MELGTELDSCNGDGQQNAQGGVHFSAFQVASTGGHKAVIWLLLKKDMEVNSPTQFWPMQLGQMFAKFLQLGSPLRPFISGQNLMTHLAHL